VGWWGRLRQKSQLEAELDAELRDHVERQVADYVREGMSEPTARRRAALAFGGVERVKEECRDARGTRFVEELGQDLRYACRVLRQSPAFTLVAVLSLALGIGANTAIFSIVESLLLRALPVREPERLVRLQGGSWTNAIWEAIRDGDPQLFESSTAWSDEGVRFDLGQGGEAQPVLGLWTSGSFFDVLGVPAILGRTFTPADDRRGGGPDGPVAVISYPFWQRRFGGDADVIGRSLTLDRVPFTIIGVTPPGFFGPSVGRAFDVAVPIGTEPLLRGRESALDRRSTWWLEIVARLRPGQTVEDATSALRRVQPRIREATLPENFGVKALREYLREGLELVPAATGTSPIRERYERPLVTLTVVVALVLLIACANVANLQLARASARRHELSVRLALGASRLRLARQLLTESFLLAAAGALLGLFFAKGGGQLLVSQISTSRDAVFLDLSLGGRVLGFSAAVAIATALLFGIAPALRAGSVEPDLALKEQGRRLVGEGRRPLGNPVTVAQVALALVLVVAAVLFIRTFSALASKDLGFARDPVLVVQVEAQGSAVDPKERAALYDRLVEAVSAVPGVARAAVSLLSPVGGMGWNTEIEVPDEPAFSGRERTSWVNAVGPGWFATYGTTILAGRDFEATDRRGSPAVAVVNQTFARRFVPEGSPLGTTVRFTGPSNRPVAAVQIVGLVRDAVYNSPRETTAPTLYIPLTQPPHADELRPFVTLGVRAANTSPALLIKSVATAIGGVDRDLTLTFRPLAEQVGGSLAQERIVAILSGFFGVLALLLAGIGLYGTTAYAVSRRRTEIGIRMALGADAEKVVRLVVGRFVRLVTLGIAIGVGLSLWASRFVASLVYGVPPNDPSTLVGSSLLLAGVAALAAWLPARRAARIDPARVLREG
jgi:predicted permease